MSLRVGIDFDNTIASFDSVFHRYALERDLIDPAVAPSKDAVREAIRQKKGNEAWTRLQSVVYSEGLAEAPMAEGLESCLSWLRQNQANIFMVSHKTAYAAAGDRVDLRAPALEWLERHGFFSKDKFDLNPEKNVFFEDTRAAKLKRIKKSRLTHFIDDLEEVFLEPDFPQGVTKIHYGASTLFLEPESQVSSFATWSQIEEFFKQQACQSAQAGPAEAAPAQ
jgi:hypothetical protein